METTIQTAPISKAALWTGRVMTALPALLLAFSAVMKLMRPPSVVQGFTHFGFSEQAIVPIGIVELACALLYVIPRTSVLGAILVTGYLGGAIATNVRGGESFIAVLILGILVWGGPYLRDRRVRSLLPFCEPPARAQIVGSAPPLNAPSV
jgi:hypothetical protein